MRPFYRNIFFVLIGLRFLSPATGNAQTFTVEVIEVWHSHCNGDGAIEVSVYATGSCYTAATFVTFLLKSGNTVIDSITKTNMPFAFYHTFENVPPGLYTIQVNSNTCSGSDMASILYWPSVTMEAWDVIPTFYGMKNGQLRLSDRAYNKLWSDYTYTFGNSPDTVFHSGSNLRYDTLSNIGADSVFVHLDYQSYNNCWTSGYMKIAIPSLPPFSPQFNITPSCFGTNSGTARLRLFPSPIPMWYQITYVSENWSGPDTFSVSVENKAFVYLLYDSANTLLGTYSSRPDSITFTNLTPGDYSVVIKRNMMTPNGAFQINHTGDSLVLNFTMADLGMNCGTISGNCYLDLNQNCVNDNQDVNLPYNLLKFSDGVYSFYALTDAAGNYEVEVGYGSHTIQLQNWIQFGVLQWCPAVQTPIIVNQSQSAVTYNIADTAYGAPDIRLSTTRTGVPRPGGTINMHITERNKSGRIVPNTQVTFTFDTILTPSYILPAPVSIQPGVVIWDADSLWPLQQNLFLIRFVLPTSAWQVPNLYYTVTADPVPFETNITNNTVNGLISVVNSWDPNDKQVEPPGYGVNHFLTPGGELDYTIRFQNTGTDTAFYVMVADTLSEFLDIGSFNLISSSHDMITDFEFPSTVKFIFNNIILPDSTTNEPESHGYVNFSIKTKTTVPNNSLLENKAAIYFDFNPPVITNTVFHTLSYTWTGLEDPVTEKNKLFTAYPNPSTGIVNITSNSGAEMDRIFVYDVYGRLVETTLFEDVKETIIDLSPLSSGIYMILIEHDQMKSHVKVIRN